MKKICCRGSLLLALILTACSPEEPNGTGPRTFIDSSPPAFTNETSATFAFGSDSSGASFECSWDDSPFAACSSPVTKEGFQHGLHRFAVRAIAGGLIDQNPATAEWFVDLYPPMTRIIAGPSLRTGEVDAEFRIQSTEEHVSFECSLNESVFLPCDESPVFRDLSDGTNSFAARSVDRAGNIDPVPATYEWEIDTVAPSTTIQVPAEPGPSLTLRFEADKASCTFTCSLDGAVHSPCSSPLRFEDLAAGEHVFSVIATDDLGNTEDPPAQVTFASREPGEVIVRITAANVSSGNYQRYEGPGVRILQGLKPDIVLIQEFNYENNTSNDIREFVDTTFGPEFEYFREPGDQIPNGIISRYPIMEAGEWNDPNVSNRDFVWARIDIPGPVDMVVVSVHFLTTSSGNRERQADEVVAYVLEHVPDDVFLVVGGDFNTKSFTESAIGTLSQIVDTSAPKPADQNGNPYTDAGRDDPYDWVLTDHNLQSLQTATVIGQSVYPNGLVFDSRVYTPLSEVAPVQVGDSAAFQMQHMAVVKDFLIPE